MSGAGDNYEAVDMEESADESGSDNEAFATKQEYKAYKEQFKVSKGQAGGAGEHANIEDKYGGRGGSEYGGGGSLPGLNRGGGQNEFGGGHPGYQGVDQGGRHDGGNQASGRRDENSRESGDSTKHRDERGGGGSGQRGDSGRDRGDHGARRGHDGGRDRRRSRSREDNRRRSRDKDEKRRSRDRDEKRRSKSRERRRSRSRSRERRDSEDRAGGWRSWNEKGGRGRGGGRDRDRRGGGGGYEERQRRREEREQEREEQVKKAEEMGVEIPKYFKPGGVQPVSYAEQVLKRKMMWSKPAAAAQQPDSAAAEAQQPAATSQQPPSQQQQQPGKTSWNKWETTNFGDGDKNEKFRRLMGIKSSEPPKAVPVAPAPSAVLSPEDQMRMQADLETNYEVARQQTHRNKGLGLGFANAEPFSAPPPQGGLVLGGFVPKNN